MGTGLEAEGELIDIARVDQDTKCQDVSSDETLDLLALERRLYCDGFNYDIVGENETHTVLVAGNALGGRSVDVDNANWLQTQLLS